MRETRKSKLFRVREATKAEQFLPQDFKRFRIEEEKPLEVQSYKAENITEELREGLLDLLQVNMKTQYETSSSGGWNREEKEEEMFSKESRHLVMMDGPELIAFSHFRFDMDYGVDVVYCYEIQINSNYQRRGIGRFLVSALERIVQSFNLAKLVLTVFTSNSSALKFYERLGFVDDDTSPGEGSYKILSKINANIR